MRLSSLLATVPLLVAAALALGAGCSGDPPAPGCDATSPCPSGQWCLYPDALCGKGATSGACTPVSELTCAAAPACGCDGKVYDSVCAAAMVGVDTTDSAQCPAPAGDFACAGTYCQAASQVCLTRRSASASACLTDVACAPIPAACASQPTCACLLGSGIAGAAATCSGDATAGLAVNDPGDC